MRQGMHHQCMAEGLTITTREMLAARHSLAALAERVHPTVQQSVLDGIMMLDSSLDRLRLAVRAELDVADRMRSAKGGEG